jgi:hypothetical protein
MEMNKSKVYGILDFIRGQGKLPTDQFGQILSVDDLMSWFGLDGTLPPAESLQVRLELALMAEAQQTLEELRMAERLRAASQS